MIAADISIAGIRFLVRSSSGLDFEPLHPAYELFRSPSDSSEFLNQIDIDIHEGAQPSHVEETLTFNMTPAYSMSRLNGDGYLLRRNLPTQSGFSWSAFFNSNFTKASIYCNSTKESCGDGKQTQVNPLVDTFDRYALTYCLGKNHGAFFHASGIDMDGNGLLFPGVSGAGKSTISSLLLQFGEAKILSDERVAVRLIGDEFPIFGTPWMGEAGIAENRSVPLKAICFLHQSDENWLELLTAQEAFNKVLSVVTIPWSDTEITELIIEFLERLMNNIPAYTFHFTPDNDAVDQVKTLIQE